MTAKKSKLENIINIYRKK